MKDLQPVLDLLWQLFDVFPVLRRQDHSFHSGSKSTNEFLLDASNRGDPATKRYFALLFRFESALLYHTPCQRKTSKRTVIAMVGGTGLPENREIKAIAWPIPLLGPSLGIAPEGQWT